MKLLIHGAFSPSQTSCFLVMQALVYLNELSGVHTNTGKFGTTVSTTTSAFSSLACKNDGKGHAE